MADYLKSIEDMYAKMYKSKEQAAAQKKQQTLAEIENQKTGVNNQYQELQKALQARKQATQAQYQGLYTNLNNQAEQGKEAYYNDRNNASLGNAQRVQQIRDYMAKNNLMSSGENVDAMLRQNTDLNNNLGRVYSEEQQFNRGIQDKRNSYLAQEQGAYGEIDNSLSAAQREQAQKISDLMNRMKLANEGYDSELMSYRDELEAKKTGEINAYNERLRQEQLAKEAEERQKAYEQQKLAEQRAWEEKQAQLAYQKQLEREATQREYEAQQAEIAYQRQLQMQREQQAASLRASQARSSSSSTSKATTARKTADTNAVWDELYSQIRDRTGEGFLQSNRSAIINNLGSSEYQKMLKYVKDYDYSAYENKSYSQRMNNRTPSYYTE